MLANWPYTLFGIMPTNRKLNAITTTGAGPESRRLIVRWGGAARRENRARVRSDRSLSLGAALTPH